ncbi:GNAT family N-acetyltransferase [Zongyangia hominis]|uniref:GNAT family N-acetyltransferase n=1 Tax=Zongyangia hominis TaxID=2763677 RepID=A0A926E9N5_9FIRM|nr:GNAT family N-acetyltransferase [Zongyangia hominis]MBC8569887.1 GNAT family N-acetyltransferase [Zongyangia hominis]
MIQFATKEMLPALKGIWKACFGDPDAYIDLYFSHRFRPEYTLVEVVHGEPLAMLTMLPCEISTDNGLFSARYIYAVATLPKAQGRGYSSALLEYAHRWMRKNGVDVSLLVPAEENLFQFYRKRGYLPAFSVREVTLSRADLVRLASEGPALGRTVELKALDAAGLYALREEFYGKQGIFVRWDEEALAYVAEENAFTGGKILRFSTDYGHGYMVCYKIGSIIAVKECGTRDETLLCRALLSAFDEDSFLLRLAADSPLFAGMGEKREFGAAVYLRDTRDKALKSLPERLTGRALDEPYLGLVLD